MRRGALLRLAVAAAAIHLALILPAAPLPAADAVTRMAPELPLVLLALGGLGGIGRAVICAALLLLLAHKAADLGMGLALGRGFNLLADLPLLPAGAALLAGTSRAAFIAAAVLAGAVAAALWWACGVWSRRRPTRAGRAGLVVLAVVLALAAGGGRVWTGNGPYLLDRANLAWRTARDLRQLAGLAARDGLAGMTGLLSAIDRDVLVIFVESYGRASLAVPFHAALHRQSLRDAETRLAGAGLAMRSGFLAAPTQGGQSWLSHATLASGLWIDSQLRHQALLASGRQGLFHHARRAGLRTAAVMPAITRPWPESATMGFDRVLAAADLGYRGKPFDWVTMPDQFTLAAADRLLRGRPGPPHLLAQIVLVSSHAPWVPVPRLLPWDSLGEGQVFDAMVAAGESPARVWRDRDRVREAYRASIDYSLRTVMDYAFLHRADPPLLIVLGDHQAAPWVAMDDRRDVPIHLIGPPHLVERAAAWGLTPGLIPPTDAAALPMDRMRDLILRGFGTVRPGG